MLPIFNRCDAINPNVAAVKNTELFLADLIRYKIHSYLYTKISRLFQAFISHFPVLNPKKYT